MRNLTLVLLLISCFTLAQNADDWKASTLQPGDVLSIQVFRVSEFSKVIRIEEDGTFRYPFCGTIKASGLTARAIAEEIEKRLAKQVQDPHVDVFVQDWGPRRIYILGEVKSSQSMELPTYGRMTALQALSAAGGFTESADLNNVAVLRRSGGKLVRHKIDVSALVSRQSGGDDFKLLPEDTLIVPKAPPVFIAGEVGNPTTIFIDTQRPPLVSELIIRAGNMKPGADAGNICIIRANAKGERDMISASLKSQVLGNYENDVRIAPGDYVLVGAAEQIYVLGEVRKPGPLTLPPDKTITASQAIALAGGFTQVAKQNDITLIRNKEIRKLNLKKLYTSIENMERDETLRNGDIIFVQESIW
ncbi:MAG: SLBB domain-containing protein [Victivallales bacterium]|nr:SLBB domain-containing protein [Victivallales bacterium]